MNKTDQTEEHVIPHPQLWEERKHIAYKMKFINCSQSHWKWSDCNETQAPQINHCNTASRVRSTNFVPDEFETSI